MTMHLPGDGPNSHWNIHRSLEMLQGLQSAAMLLIRKMDQHVEQRDAGSGEHPHMMGNAVAVVVLTSYATEIALKTLHALNKPYEPPPRGHYLMDLYDQLEATVKAEAQQSISELPPLGAPSWIGENPDIRALICQGNSNFSDWRYLPERPRVESGVPKVLVNIVQVIQELCLKRVLRSPEVANDKQDGGESS